jgi:hypothetical protein
MWVLVDLVDMEALLVDWELLMEVLVDPQGHLWLDPLEIIDQGLLEEVPWD